MSSTRHPNRRYVRQRTPALTRDASPSRAARLAGRAGEAPCVEQLEQRQLLFSLTVGTDFDMDGYGTIQGYFAYSIPYLYETAVMPDDDDTTPDYLELIEEKIFGVYVSFTAPLGATITFFDLYDREMEQTLFLGQPMFPEVNVDVMGEETAVTFLDRAVSDLEDDGIPYGEAGDPTLLGNVGIGRIEINGADAFSVLQIFGGRVEALDPETFAPEGSMPGFGPNPDPGSDYDIIQIIDVTDYDLNHDGVINAFDTWPTDEESPTWNQITGPVLIAFGFTLERSIEGMFDDFQEAGFGYTLALDGSGAVGLPPSPGSVIIGSPFVRPYANYLPDGLPAHGGTIIDDFSGDFQGRDDLLLLAGEVEAVADQGININGSIRMVQVHGVVHGVIDVDETIRTLNVGLMLGDVQVAGDAGKLIFSSDLGGWQSPESVLPSPTNSQITIGRSISEVMVAGRNFANIFVTGDLEDSDLAILDNLVYRERERTANQNPAFSDDESVFSAMIAAGPLMELGAFRNSTPDTFFGGAHYLRNDSILAAEWIGSSSTTTTIVGTVGALNGVQAEDEADVFGFAVNGTTPVIVESLTGAEHLRIVDSDGRTVAALITRNARAGSLRMTFNPEHAGVYYLVITTPTFAGDLTNFTNGYAVTITGMAPTTLGSVRTGSTFGHRGTSPSIWTLSGSIGSIRIGTAWLGNGVEEVDPSEFLNADDVGFSFDNGEITSAGHFYGLIVRDDIQGTQFLDGSVSIVINTSGDLGVVYTGVDPFDEEVNFEDGDVYGVDFNIGGRIALLDINGSVGVESDGDTPDWVTVSAPIRIYTGLVQDSGDIGVIRIDGHANGQFFDIVTKPGSVIDALMTNQDPTSVPDAPNFGFLVAPPTLTLGPGSDLRFADFPNIVLLSGATQLNIIAGQTLILTDDAGGTVSVRISGSPAAPGTTIGAVRILPVDGSEGVAIGEIEANLTGDATLEITSIGGDETAVISVGRIQITGATANSRIVIGGPSQVDVYRIEQTGGEAFFSITNSTPLGDIIAADVIGLNRLVISSGSLGETEMTAFGPRTLGPFLGVTAGLQTTVGAPLGIPDFAENSLGGDLYRPIGEANGAFREDFGSPLSPYLNGLVVRTGDVQLVSVAGSVHDVITQGGALVSVIADADGLTTPGGFEGIEGTIFSATNIDSVLIGDGLVAPGDSTIAEAGIFAVGTIVSVVGVGSHVDIRGVITGFGGIDLVQLTGGGDFIDAYIGGTNLEGWVTSTMVAGADPAFLIADIANIFGSDADFFRSHIAVDNLLGSVSLQGGLWDASTLVADGNVNFVGAAGFRNSTLSGGSNEFQDSYLSVDQNLTTVTTLGLAGDMDDLRITVTGTIFGEISANNISRLTLNVNNEIAAVIANGSVRASSIEAGALRTLSAGKDITGLDMVVSGPVLDISAGDRIIYSRLEVTGPDGSFGNIVAQNLLSATITATGPIGLIRSNNADVVATITTVGNRGNVGTIQAARDLNIITDISQTVTTLRAGRHIGQMGDARLILVRGNVQTVDVGSGQIYSDLRVGQSITGAIILGRVNSKPGQSILSTRSIIAFGSINSAQISGDFAGQLISHTGGIGTVTINDGSLLTGAGIFAYDGNIGTIAINDGDLLGTVHADYIIFNIRLTDDTGLFGNIGVDPAKSSGVSVDSFRNELPTSAVITAGRDGATITAGQNIGTIDVAGSVFESIIKAGWGFGVITIDGSIGSDSLTPGISSIIAAGDSIYELNVAGDVRNAIIIAGLLDFGDDGLIGGVGANADTLKSGWIRTIDIDGAAVNTTVVAGITAGADGNYRTIPDNEKVLGVSYVDEISVGAGSQYSVVMADSHIGTVSGNILAKGTGLGTENTLIDPVLARTVNDVPDFAAMGQRVTVNSESGLNFSYIVGATTYTGKIVVRYTGGSLSNAALATVGVVWDATNHRVILINTTLDHEVEITSDSGVLEDFSVVTNDDASIGVLEINADLIGDSNIVIDGYSRRFEMGSYDGTGQILFGGDVLTADMASFIRGTLTGAHVGEFTIGGDLGDLSDVDDTTDAMVQLLSGTTFRVEGSVAALLSFDRSLNTLNIDGALDNALVRFGGSVATVRAASMNETFLAAGNSVSSVTITGDATDSVIAGGLDLGRNGRFNTGAGSDDVLSSGSVGDVTVGGDFERSDVIAGIHRGADGFFGTADDQAAPGRSAIASVTIGGDRVGSNLGSESYRISGTGNVGTVRIAGSPGFDQGNFKIDGLDTLPSSLGVESLRVTLENGRYIARIKFDDPIDRSTLAAALSIEEVRDGGATVLGLTLDTHYSITYDALTRTALITFSTDITRRDLVGDPEMPDPANPGPGIYRFTIDADVIKGLVSNAELDGNGDGVPTPSEDYIGHALVGDAGDRLIDNTVQLVDPQGNLIAGAFADFYAATDLDLLLDDPFALDGLPETNTEFTFRGQIGNHPDHHPLGFRQGGDVDVFKLTLQAGQILRLSEMTGAASGVLRVLIDPAENLVAAVGAAFTDDVIAMPSADLTPFEENYLVATSGTYYLVVNWPEGLDDDPAANPPFAQGTIGDYTFTLEIFDDGDSGFAGDNDAGDGADVIDAPVDYFDGADNVFGTADDATADITLSGFTFTRLAGEDDELGTSDDVITGDNGAGIESTWSMADGFSSLITSAIGHAGAAGRPETVFADADVYHISGGDLIDAGTRYRITIQLDEFGSNLGSQLPLPPDVDLEQALFGDFDHVGEVQFGVYDTTNATSVSDALLVFSTTEFSAYGGETGVLASNSTGRYGFDDNGDFYIEFTTVGQIDATGNAPASYAVYLQGVFNADYKILIETLGTRTLRTFTQNVFIELNGGSIDWLEAGGLTTQLDGFNAAAIGFEGSIGLQSVNDYMIDRLLTTLTTVFDNLGFDVNFSTNAADFEFQPFSTVFISTTPNPVSTIGGDELGYSEHSDALNMDRNDEAVIFLTPYSLFGYTPNQDGIDDLTDSLAIAVSKRVGELVGLRVESGDAVASGNIMALGSEFYPTSIVFNPANLTFSDEGRAHAGFASGARDTQFFLGTQLAFDAGGASLLDKILTAN